MHQRFIIASIVPLLIALGLWGQYQLSPDNITEHFSRSLYQIISLFFLEGEWTLELARVPIALEIVRFLAPLVAIASFILVFAATTRTSLANYSVRFYSGHTVIVGLGQKCWQFLQTCEDRRDVVVVEREPENRFVERARGAGVKVLVGDILEAGMFDRLGLKGASTLIALTDNDGTNVELAIKARDYVRTAHEHETPLRIHIHLNEIGLASQLEGYPKFFADYAVAQMSFFSLYDLSSRLLLRDYPPEIYADVAGQDRIHLCIYGFSKLSEKLIVEAAQVCHYADGHRLRFSVFDEQAERKGASLHAMYPNLSKICDCEFYDMPAFGGHVLNNFLGEKLSSVTLHISCRESDEQNLNTALILRKTLLEHRGCNAPILVRMQHSSGLAQLLESNTGSPEIPDGLYPFGMLDEVLRADNILTSQLDELARTIHQMYLQLSVEGSARTHKALQSWEALPQLERKQNLLKADHWPVRLRAIRCVTSPKTDGVLQFTREESELQARMEHSRYVSQKLFDGWVYGEERLEDAKINPYLVDWDELPGAQQGREIREVEIQPDAFSRHSGRTIKRSYVIGVTGHRLDKLDIECPGLRARVTEALEGLKRERPDAHFVVLTSLAEGSDRLVAKLAQEVLGASLQVPLPLPYELYISDFSSQESIEEFKQMVGHADVYYEMPMRFGNARELAVGNSDRVNEARNGQYALAGAYIAQRSDCLLAIYDGQTTNGTGGTRQVLGWYQGETIEPQYHYPAKYFMAPSRHPAIIISPTE